MIKVSLYCEVKDMALDGKGNPCPAGMMLTLGYMREQEYEKRGGYWGIAEEINPMEVLEYFRVNAIKPENIRIISPEEYAQQYASDENDDCEM